MGLLGRLPALATARDALMVARQSAAMRRSAVDHEPSPPIAGLVLEVGAGQSPQPRTDVVVEKYLFDDHERPGEATFSFNRPVVVADAEHLPFADDTFAYSICLHVLEHAVQPGRFAGELSRVSTAGFVQVPSRLAELTFGWDYHPWLIDKSGQTLVFEPKLDVRAPAGSEFHGLFARDELTRLWFNAHRELWHHSLAWTDRLEVEVRGSSSAASTALAQVEQTVQGLLEVTARRPLPRLSADARGALRCPSCQGCLLDVVDRMDCAVCARSYPCPGGVPVLLLEAAA